MPSYKLTYFNGRGRAELTRLLFHATDTKFEDVRIEREKWPAMKPSTPFGQLPILEVDGIMLCQSNTVARFVARRVKLAGKTDLEEARADMIIDCVEDTIKPMVGFIMEKDETKKAELKNKYMTEQLPVFLDDLEKLLKANKGGDGYIVGDSLTWADLGILVLDGWLSLAGASGELAKRPKLAALKDRVEKLPKIAAWIAKRPKTEF
jgi:glutathione S-transferase